MSVPHPNLTTPGELNAKFPVPGREEGSGYLTLNECKMGLVLLQEWWGVNKTMINKADLVAKFGFRVLVVDVYRGKVAKSYEEAGHHKKGLDFGGAVQDIAGGAQYLKTLGCLKIGVMGFCMGGALSIAAVASIPADLISASVPYYGTPDLDKTDFSKVRVPMLAHFATLDHAKGFSDLEAAKNLEKAALAAGTNFKLVLWEGADHGFMNPDRATFHPKYHEESLKMSVEFLKEHLSS